MSMVLNFKQNGKLILIVAINFSHFKFKFLPNFYEDTVRKFISNGGLRIFHTKHFFLYQVIWGNFSIIFLMLLVNKHFSCSYFKLFLLFLLTSSGSRIDILHFYTFQRWKKKEKSCECTALSHMKLLSPSIAMHLELKYRLALPTVQSEM